MAKNEIQTQEGVNSKSVEKDDFLETLQQRLLSQSGSVSSSDSAIEKSIKDSISGIEKSQEASAARIESQFGREIDFKRGQQEAQISTQLEGRRGFATNMTALRQLVETTDKQVNDLEQRKQELILQGESAAASRISELQIKQLEFKTEAQQRTFNNLLQMANFGLGLKQEDRLERQQEFTEQQAVGNIALEFGIKPEPGDNLQSMLIKAQPFASEQRALELQKAQNQIELMNKEIQKINIDINRDSGEFNIDVIAESSLTHPEVLQGLAKNPDLFAKVIKKRNEIEGSGLVIPLVDRAIEAGDDLETIISDLGSSPMVRNKLKAQEIATERFMERSKGKPRKKGLTESPTGSPLVNLLLGTGAAVESGLGSVVGFVTGRKPRGALERLRAGEKVDFGFF